MRIDRYTKTILTLIAMLLAVIAFRPIIQPDSVAAQGNFAGVQFSGAMGGFWAFDTKTGDVWVYSEHKWEHPGKITKLGQPLVQ